MKIMKSNRKMDRFIVMKRRICIGYKNLSGEKRKTLELILYSKEEFQQKIRKEEIL